MNPPPTNYSLARQIYADFGVETETAQSRLASIPIALHCGRGDGVGGFEQGGGDISGAGIQVTGNYPGKARTLEELWQDMEEVLALLPGRHMAKYGDFGGKAVDRNEITPAHFQSWIDWTKGREAGLDFNPTYFSHRLANDGATLTHWDPAVRQFRFDHVVTLDDPTRAIMEEIVRGDFLDRVPIGLNYFDATIKRIAAWVIGTRSTINALLVAWLDPSDRLRALEVEVDLTSRPTLLEEMKTLPIDAV